MGVTGLASASMRGAYTEGHGTWCRQPATDRPSDNASGELRTAQGADWASVHVSMHLQSQVDQLDMHAIQTIDREVETHQGGHIQTTDIHGHVHVPPVCVHASHTHARRQHYYDPFVYITVESANTWFEVRRR